MSFPSRKAAVVGVYNSKQARSLDTTPWKLELECIQGALADAGLTHKDLDGLVPISGDGLMRHLRWAEQLGGRPIRFMDVGIAAGAVTKAAVACATGLANVVVIFNANAGMRVGPQGNAIGQPRSAVRLNDMNHMIHGAYMSAWYALWTRRYMHQFNIPQEHLAAYSVIARHHAVLNPESVMGVKGEITVDDVFNSRMICDPLHLLECSLDNDGGYAIVVASEAVARGCKTPPVWVLGGSEAAYTDFYESITPDWISEKPQALRTAADASFAMAGVTRDDIDVAGMYDCFPVTMARNIEEAGFCKLGEGAAYMQEGNITLGGKMPTNTDGGLLSHSHNGNPSGFQVVEVTRQLRGECGARQVPDAKIGLALSQGWAVHGIGATAILAAD
jgi:acetyl-CoA acetyltransferase